MPEDIRMRPQGNYSPNNIRADIDVFEEWDEEDDSPGWLSKAIEIGSWGLVVFVVCILMYAWIAFAAVIIFPYSSVVGAMVAFVLHSFVIWLALISYVRCVLTKHDRVPITYKVPPGLLSGDQAPQDAEEQARQDEWHRNMAHMGMVFNTFGGNPHDGKDHDKYPFSLNALILCILSFMFLFAVGGLLLFHIQLTVTNQTTLESMRRPRFTSKTYRKNGFDMGYYRNFKFIMGNTPWLWLVPVGGMSGDPFQYDICRSEDEETGLMNSLQAEEGVPMSL
eukprot:Clim_evm67s128 gene=Clim_evmTU67s128